jgi:hypothetical protein
MGSKGNKIVTINAPRSVFVLFSQSVGIFAPVGTEATMVAIVFSSGRHVPLDGLLFLLFFTLFLFALAFVMFYFPGRRIPQLIFDREAKLCTKIKRGHEPKTFDLSAVQQILSKRTFTNPGWKYSMVLLDGQGGSQSVFNENTFYVTAVQNKSEFRTEPLSFQ